jgi:hypothetical protein
LDFDWPPHAIDDEDWEMSPQDVIVDPVIEGASRSHPPTLCETESAMKLRDGVAAINGTKPLFFFGYVKFRDAFKREYRYFWRFEYDGSRFVLASEYEQEIKSQ